MKFSFVLKIYIISFINISICRQFERLLKNNPDLEKLKRIMKEDGETWDERLETVVNENNYRNITNLKIPKPVTKKWSVRNFYLFTRDYRRGTIYEILDPRNISSIKSSHFHSRQTYVIIHGFIGYGLEPWILTLKDEFLKKEDCNVISVDWPAGSSWFLPTYISAADKVAFVGNNTALLMYNLVAHKGLLLKEVHCIGHSLGGHVCGFMGKPFPGRVGRISALDPAGPLFHQLNGTKRLDKKDGIYVDVMHTNACEWDYWMDCYGLNENIGHSDFYPNGGQHQPACATIFDGRLRGEIGCNHEMAYIYYMESLNYSLSSTYFLARPCDNWYHYAIDNCTCGEAPQYMGFNVNTEIEGVFFLETNQASPYAKQDSECSGVRPWNFLIIIGYVLAAAILFSCIVTIFVITIKNVRRCLGRRRSDTGEGSLENSHAVENEERSGVEEDASLLPS